MIKKVVREGRLKGVALPGDRKQQYISQYTNDSSFMVRGDKHYVDEMMRILKVFIEASGMKIMCVWV